jgi:hypothetical protein
MTTLVAIAEPGREQGSEPKPSALLLSVLLHTVVVLLLIVAARLLPPAPADLPPQERAVEVVMVPPAQPPAPAQPTAQPQGEIPLERMNLSEQAEVAQESRAPAPAAQAEPDRPREQAAQRTRDQDLPPAPIAAAPPAPPTPEPRPAPPQPTPAQAPAAAPSRFEIDPRSIRTFEPPPGVGEEPPQVAAVPRLTPAPPRASGPQSLPQRPQSTQPPGELREVDLFGSARLPPRRSTVTQQSNAQVGARSTQSEAAFILRQVLQVWTVDYRNPRYREVMLSLRMPLQADGTLGYPWGRNDPWLPYLLIDRYAEFLRPGMESQRRLLESFAYAIKLAQPYQIPPTPGPYPRTVVVSFRMGDL